MSIKAWCKEHGIAISTLHKWLKLDKKQADTDVTQRWAAITVLPQTKGGSVLLQGFKGYLHTDGWGGYHQLEANGVTLCGYWAHARRKFNEALAGCADKTNLPEAKGEAFCNALFEKERVAAKMSALERYDLRQKESKPLTEEFFDTTAWFLIFRTPTAWFLVYHTQIKI